MEYLNKFIRFSKVKIVSCSNSLNFVNDLNNFSREDILKDEISKFENGEILVKLNGVDTLHNEDVLIIQSIADDVNDALIELLFTADLINTVVPKSIYVLITYLGYSRQDRILSSFESFSLKVVSKMLSQKYISKIFVVNVHTPQTVGFFNVPSMNILIEDIIIDNIKNKFNTRDIVLVSPDIGNAKNVIAISNKLGVDCIIGIKNRLNFNESKLLHLSGCNVKDKICIIYDDIIDSAKTVCDVANLLKQQEAKDIFAFVVHGILSKKSFDTINSSSLNKIFITNTIDFSKKIVYSPKIEMISITDWCINLISKYMK